MKNILLGLLVLAVVGAQPTNFGSNTVNIAAVEKREGLSPRDKGMFTTGAGIGARLHVKNPNQYDNKSMGVLMEDAWVQYLEFISITNKAERQAAIIKFMQE